MIESLMARTCAPFSYHSPAFSGFCSLYLVSSSMINPFRSFSVAEESSRLSSTALNPSSTSTETFNASIAMNTRYITLIIF
jgi:hypothetical protein